SFASKLTCACVSKKALVGNEVLGAQLMFGPFARATHSAMRPPLILAVVARFSDRFSSLTVGSTTRSWSICKNTISRYPHGSWCRRLAGRYGESKILPYDSAGNDWP